MIHLLERFILAVGGSLPASIVVKATVIAALALIGTRLARGSRAAVRHVLLAAAFGVLLLLPLASVIAPPIQIAVRTVEQESAVLLPAPAGVGPAPRLSSADTSRAAIPALSRSYIPSLSTLLLFAWLAGVALSLIPMLVGLREVRALRRAGLPWREGQALVDRLAAETGMAKRVEVLLHESLPGPVASGALHPAILLPENAERWESDDLHRALVHELEHVRRADVVVHSLARAVCSLYWFHPLVWMAWRQLTLEAERACDDAVLKSSEATDYADQLVALARKLLASEKSPLVAMANRSDLAIRVGAVLDTRQRRGRAGRFAVALACAAAVVLVLTMSPLRMVCALQSTTAQTSAGSSPATGLSAPSLSFEVATIKPNRSGDPHRGGIRMRPANFTVTNGTTRDVIAYAYNVKDFQVSGGPSWINSEKYDIDAKVPDSLGKEWQVLASEQRREQIEFMVQSLLADRFKLKASHQTKEVPVYALVVAKSGPKLHEAKPGDTYPNGFKGADGIGHPGVGTINAGQIRGQGIPMASAQGMSLAFLLSALLDRPILDQTGLKGTYDITLQWTPDQSLAGVPIGAAGGTPGAGAASPDTSGPSLFTAIQEQLGLKLESTKAPVDVIVIDHIERPSEN